MEVISQLSHDGWSNFSYTVVGKDHVAWCVDPWDGAAVFEPLRERGIPVVGIINTHGHGDHTRGNEELARLSGAPILSRETLLEKNTLSLGPEETIEVIPANGHTMDHVVFILREQGRITGIVAGDVLFNFGVGNCKNGGDVETLFKTIQTLNALLPDDCILYPGHDYMETNLGFAMANGVAGAAEFMDAFEDWAGKQTTMALERKINPFLRARSLTEFRKLRSQRDKW